MKKRLVKIIRKLMPTKLVRLIEEIYRKLRLQLISLKYGNPAKDISTIAITGTNGKTTTLNFVNEILKAGGYKTAMFTTAVIEIAGERKLNELNATIPTTEELFRFFSEAKKQKVDYLLLEVTSHALHQHKIPKLNLKAAIFTNLTQDHLDYHKTMEEYARAKSLLWAMNPEISVINKDDKWFEYFYNLQSKNSPVIYGKSNQADYKIETMDLNTDFTSAKFSLKGEEIYTQINIPGEFNVYNALAAASLAFELKVDKEAIVDGIAQLKQLAGRLQKVENNKSLDIIVDYAHTPDSIEKILQMGREITKNKVALVFGATGDRDKTKRPIMGELAAKYADKIFLTDEESYNENPDEIRKMILAGIAKGKGLDKTTEIADRKKAIEAAIVTASKGDLILITGMGHENFRIINGQKVAWNDAKVAKEILEAN